VDSRGEPNTTEPENARVLLLVAVLILGAFMTALVVRWQIAHRAPLVWDEARRVQPGVDFTRALSTHSFGRVFDWANAQTFYPFLSSFLSGIVLWLGGGFTAAAWLPVLLAYDAAGIAAAALARAISLSRPAVAGTAILVWTTPLLIKLAGGGFTEPLGACFALAVLFGLVSLRRGAAAYPVAIVTGLLAGVATMLKYDYGILLLATIAISELIRVAFARSLRNVSTAVALLATAVGTNALFFSFNTRAKVAGVKDFVRGSSGDSNASLAKTLSRIDFVAYPRQLFTSSEIGLNVLVAVAMLAGIVVAARLCRSRPYLAPLLVFSGIWWVMYSLGGAKFARYTGTILPLLCVFAALAVDQVAEAIRRRDLRWGAAACWALVALAVLTQIPAATQKFEFLKSDPPVEHILAFLRSNLRPSDRPLLFVGMSNELSPELVHLVWDDATGHRNGGAQTVGEAPPQKRVETFQTTLAASQPEEVLVVTFDHGSRIDTADYKSHFGSQRTYARLVRSQELAGVFKELASFTTDHGRLHVRLLTAAPKQ
jgi:hypothetical protein